jgi:hypothetical protein
MAKKRRRELVWSVEWDSGGMGGGGVEQVYRVDGRYVYVSDGCGTFGPADDLKGLLAEHQLTDVNGATHTFTSPLFTAAEMAGMLVSEVEPGGRVEVNGELWEYRGPEAGWTPVPEGDE